MRGTWVRSLGLALACACRLALSQVSISRFDPASIYDTQPVLRVRGTGFRTVGVDALTFKFLPSLAQGTDYTLSLPSGADPANDYLVLTLVEGKKWADVSSGEPKDLYLTELHVSGGDNLLDSEVQVARVVPMPTVEGSDKVIYQKATPRLVLNGTNFNIKHTELYFDPPLNEGTQFNMQVLNDHQIVLVKVFGEAWRADPGPLKLIAINNGGGRLPLVAPKDQGEAREGLLIAEVQADLEGHGVMVMTHEDQKVYQSSPSLTIDGVGFNPVGTQLRFGNGLRGPGASTSNYTVESITESEIKLKLVEGSKWRLNGASLPGPLVLLAADAGSGYVALGPTAAKSGRKVATVYEDPDVEPSSVEVYRTHTPSIVVHGAGFHDETPPIFTFDPPRTLNVDYNVHVRNSTVCELALLSAWLPEGQAGPLKVVALDTGAGMKTLAKPTPIATIVDDSAPHESGVTVSPGYDQTLYQSEAIKKLTISGTGFTGQPQLSFDPPLTLGTDYTMTVDSTEHMTLTLKPGMKWRKAGGALLATAVLVGDHNVELAEGKGIKVATILSDPVIFEGASRIYATHSKQFVIRGSGFVSVQDPFFTPKVQLDQTPPANYQVDNIKWDDTEITLVLKSGSWAQVRDSDTVTLKVTKLDTGGGEVDLDVAVAIVHADSNEVTCDDSCEYANDNQCDEAQAGGGVYGYGWYYDDDANWYMDDDYGYGYQYAGYESTFAYYGDDDANFGGYGSGGRSGGIAACMPGTDCTDCGISVVEDGMCENTCSFARDGHCDDPRVLGNCLMGTDCQDCGPVGAANHTDIMTAYMTNDWYTSETTFLFDDDWVSQGQEANAVPIYKRNFQDHESTHRANPVGPGKIFVQVLWAIVILVGGSVSLGFCMLIYRHYKGQSTGVYLPVTAPEELEMARRGGGSGVTPDVVRIG